AARRSDPMPTDVGFRTAEVYQSRRRQQVYPPAVSGGMELVEGCLNEGRRCAYRWSNRELEKPTCATERRADVAARRPYQRHDLFGRNQLFPQSIVQKHLLEHFGIVLLRNHGVAWVCGHPNSKGGALAALTMGMYPATV